MTGRQRVAILSDTHAPRFWKCCPPRVAEHLEGADLILHGGDVCTVDVLLELEMYAPVCAVLGNNDGSDVADWGATEVLELEISGLSVAMIHDSGQAAGRMARMRSRFTEAGLVVFGHSHIPWDEEAEGQRVFNPGSPTDKRRQLCGTIGMLEVEDGRILSLELISVTG